jgi:hypothetical protein
MSCPDVDSYVSNSGVTDPSGDDCLEPVNKCRVALSVTTAELGANFNFTLSQSPLLVRQSEWLLDPALVPKLAA